MTTTSQNLDCIFLTGYMGAGKSTIGKLLAKKLGYKFFDTDKELVKRFDKSISKIFKEDGEPAFRKAELDILKELVGHKPVVISAGGGTLTRDDTFQVAREGGVLIYLKAPVNELFERVIFSPKDRPMIDIPDAETVFEERFKAREPYYERSDVVIETHNYESEEVVRRILETELFKGVAHGC